MTLFKRFLAFFFLMLLLFTSIFPSAHTAAWLAVDFDSISQSYDGSAKKASDDHPEMELINLENFANYNPAAGDFSSPGWKEARTEYVKLKNKPGVSTADFKSFYKTYVGSPYPDDWFTSLTDGYFVAGPFILTFPAVHAGSLDLTGAYCKSNLKIERQNEMRAERVVENTIKGLNDCLRFVSEFAYPDGCTNTEFQILAVDLAIRSEEIFKGQSPTPLTVGTVEFTFAPSSEGFNGLPKEYFLTVTTAAGHTGTFCFACPKGYVPKPYTDGWLRTDNRVAGQYYDPLYKHGDHEGGGDIGNSQVNKLKSKGDALFINWSIIIASANYSHDVKGSKTSDLAVVEDGGPLAELIGKFFKWAISSIEDKLNLVDIEDFMLIQGDVDKYVYGIFPYSWVQASLLLYAVSLSISLALIGFSVLKIIWKQQLSTINVGEKVALQEDLKNLIVTLFLFFAFIPIFIFLAGLNASLVRLFGSAITETSSNGMLLDDYYHSPSFHMPIPTYDNFGSIVLAIAELILKIYFNAFYIVRGATIAALIGVAPLAIYSLSLGGKYTGVFTAYFKELISQIFAQTIHAMMLAFFFNSIRFQASGDFVMLVILYSMIPITKFIKTKVFQLSEGPASQVGMNTVKTMTGLASGAMKGATNFNPGRNGGKSDGEGGRSGGGKSGGGDSMLSSAIDRNATTTRKPSNESIEMKDSSGKTEGKTSQNYIRDANLGAATKLASGLGRSALTAARGGLYAGTSIANVGMGVGMGMLGEDPSKHMEQAGASMGKAIHTYGLAAKQGIGAAGAFSKYHFDPHSGRHQYIREAEEAGITGIRKTGGSMTYGINSDTANEYHQGLYENIKQAYTPSGVDKDGKKEFTAQQKNAQTYYRNNYGITGVRSDGPDGKKMQIDIDSAAMDAHRMSETNPFAGMKTFEFKPEKPEKDDKSDT